MADWIFSFLPSRKGGFVQSRNKRKHGHFRGDPLRAAKRARRVAQQKERLRMFGLHRVEGWTERDFQTDRLQSTAEQLFGNGLLAIKEGKQEKAFEFFRTGALAGSVNSMIEFARCLLFAEKGCPNDVESARAILEVTNSKHSQVSPNLFKECDRQIAATELKLAKAPVAANDLKQMVELLGNKHDNVREMVAKALADMAKNKIGTKAIAYVPDGLAKLTFLLDSKNEAILRPVAWTLANVTDDVESRRAVAANPGSLEKLVALLRSEYRSVRNAAVQAVGNVAFQAENHTIIAGLPGALEGFVELLCSEDEDAQMHATGTLAGLSASDAAICEAIAATPNSLVRLVGLLGSARADEQVLGDAACALANIAAASEDEEKAIAAVPGSLEAVIKLLSHENLYVREKAAAALDNLTDMVENRKRVAAQSGVWEALLKLLGSESVEAQESAALTLAKLLVDDESKKSFAAVPTNVERLVRLSGSKNPIVRENIEGALKGLALDEEAGKVIAAVREANNDKGANGGPK